MNSTSTKTHFDQQYQTHLKHLKLKGLQPKTIEAYSRAIRRIGQRFDHQIDHLTEQQLLTYFSEPLIKGAGVLWHALPVSDYPLKKGPIAANALDLHEQVRSRAMVKVKVNSA